MAVPIDILFLLIVDAVVIGVADFFTTIDEEDFALSLAEADFDLTFKPAIVVLEDNAGNLIPTPDNFKTFFAFTAVTDETTEEDEAETAVSTIVTGLILAFFTSSDNDLPAVSDFAINFVFVKECLLPISGDDCLLNPLPTAILFKACFPRSSFTFDGCSVFGFLSLSIGFIFETDVIDLVEDDTLLLMFTTLVVLIVAAAAGDRSVVVIDVSVLVYNYCKNQVSTSEIEVRRCRRRI